MVWTKRNWTKLLGFKIHLKTTKKTCSGNGNFSFYMVWLKGVLSCLSSLQVIQCCLETFNLLNFSKFKLGLFYRYFSSIPNYQSISWRLNPHQTVYWIRVQWLQPLHHRGSYFCIHNGNSRPVIKQYIPY